MSDSGSDYGFCANKLLSSTSIDCFNLQGKDNCNKDTNCIWKNMVGGEDDMRTNWNLYKQQQNLTIPDYVADACGNTGTKFGVTTPVAGKTAKYSDCIQATNHTETTYQHWNGSDKSCSYIMSCLKKDPLKYSSISNDRKIEKREKDSSLWEPLTASILPENPPNKNSVKQKIDKWEYKKCLNSGNNCDYFMTHNESNGGLPDSYGCNQGVINKPNTNKYVCNTKTLACELDEKCNSTNTNCIPFQSCNLCDIAPTGSLLYNIKYKKLFANSINISTGNNRSGDLYIAPNHESYVLAGTASDDYYTCGEFMFIPTISTSSNIMKRGEFFLIKFTNGDYTEGYYLRRGGNSTDYGNLAANTIISDECIFSISSVENQGDNKYINITERFTLQNNQTLVDISSYPIDKKNIDAMCFTHSIPTMSVNIKFTTEKVTGWNYTLFKVIE
jgi:hypothetical protein